MSGGFPIGHALCNGTDAGTDATASTGKSLAGSGSGSIGVYGSWVTIIASTAADATYIQVQCNGHGWSNNQGTIEIGIGSAGNEVIIAADLVDNSGNLAVVYNWCFPCNIPAGTRIAARSCSPVTGIGAPTASVILFDSAFGNEGFAGLDSIGYVSATALGTQIDPGGTANTKGSFAQLSASTPRDYAGLTFVTDSLDGTLSQAGALVLIDIAIGAAASEKVIIPNVQRYVPGTGSGSDPIPIVYIDIPAGSRVSARAASAINTANARLFGLTAYGLYK